MTTVALVVCAATRLMSLSWSTCGSLSIGIVTAVAAYRVLEKEEVRSLLLEILVFALVATYALWIPTQIGTYLIGVACGAVISWQWPLLLSLACAVFGISQVKVYPDPHWQPGWRPGQPSTPLERS